MRKYLIFLPFVFLFSGCTTFMFSSYPDDFSVKYNFQSHTTGLEQNIEITQYYLKFSFKKPGVEKKFAPINIHDDPSLSDLYDYIKNADILDQPQPGSEVLSDTPVEYIKVTFDENSNTINIGDLKVQPEKLTKLRSMLFNVVSAYYPDWKKEAGLE